MAKKKNKKALVVSEKPEPKKQEKECHSLINQVSKFNPSFAEYCAGKSKAKNG